MQTPANSAPVVEADRSEARRQDAVAMIEPGGFFVVIDGTKHRICDPHGLVGVALRCLLAHEHRS